jgi:hypothetical protein
VYDKENDVERLLREDARDKKRTGNGVFSRASRRGYTGAIRTTVDYLKGKEKKQYMGNGEVKMYNIYDDINNIPSAREIMKMDFETAKKILEQARARHNVKDLRDHWKISSKVMYSELFDKHGLERAKKGGNMWAKHKEALGKPVQNTVETVIAPQPVYTAPFIKAELPDEDGFEIKYIKHEVTGKDIMERIADYLTVLEEGTSYEIKFIIKEKK